MNSFGKALQAHPAICMTFATAILFTSNRHSPETKSRLQLPLQIAEQHWQREGNDYKLGEVFAFRSLVAWLQRDFKESFSCAREALARLPENDRQWRQCASIMLVDHDRGRLNTARQTISWRSPPVGRPRIFMARSIPCCLG
jgi:ATP/maltotriose-dependent transcriptional regulator MalT